MGYNLAIEYLADFEKTWMLGSFKELNSRVLAPQKRALKEWLFLEVCPAVFFLVLLHAKGGMRPLPVFFAFTRSVREGTFPHILHIRYSVYAA